MRLFGVVAEKTENRGLALFLTIGGALNAPKMFKCILLFLHTVQVRFSFSLSYWYIYIYIYVYVIIEVGWKEKKKGKKGWVSHFLWPWMVIKCSISFKLISSSNHGCICILLQLFYLTWYIYVYMWSQLRCWQRKKKKRRVKAGKRKRKKGKH